MILGIDPGLHGAFAFYDPTTKRVVNAVNVPTFEITRNSKVKKSLDLRSLVDIIKKDKALIYHAFLEQVGPMSKQGVSSVWSFSRTHCAPETALTAFDVPFTQVPSRVWKKAVGAPADKDGSRLRASQLMPEDAYRWTPKRGFINQLDAEGIAEAALIAYYGATKYVLTAGCVARYNTQDTPSPQRN